MRKQRVLVAKPGLDGHDRGAKVLCQALRDAGMEVIYTGLHQTPEMITRAAVEEDVDVVCVSILSGAHNQVLPEILNRLKAQGVQIPVVAGGIIPDADIEKLKGLGVKAVFTSGAELAAIVTFVQGIGMR